MKTLDLTENQLLSKIVKHYHRGEYVRLFDIMDKEFENIEIQFNYQNRTITLRFDRREFQNDQALKMEAQNITWKLMKFVTLLKDLQDQKYLYLYQDFPDPKPSRLGAILNNENSISHQVSDPIVCDLLNENFLKIIVISKYLIDYVNDNFRTREQVRHDENLKISVENLKAAQESVKKSSIAVYIAVITGIASLIVGVISIIMQMNPSLNLDQKQYDSITKRLIEITKSNDSINHTIENSIFQINELKMNK